MPKDYQTITQEISKMLAKLREEIPEVLQGFNQLAMAASGEGALDKKTKELIALALGIASHCDGCIGFHVKALVKLGVTREEFTELLGMAVYMGGGPSMMFAAEALMAFEQFSSS